MRKLPVFSSKPVANLAWAFALAMLTSSLPLLAQNDLEKPPPIPPESQEDVPIPPKVQSDEQFEPTVTIREEEKRTIEEYRMNGQVYMVKVTPKGGVPYYLIDTDGDGQFDYNAQNPALAPVQPVFWKIKEWK
jgi:hypothetical protein